jgi:hypothetical protein
VTLDRDALAAHPRRALSFNLYKDGWELRKADRPS